MGKKLLGKQLRYYVAVASCFIIMGNTHDKGRQNELGGHASSHTQKLSQKCIKSNPKSILYDQMLRRKPKS